MKIIDYGIRLIERGTETGQVFTLTEDQYTTLPNGTIVFELKVIPSTELDTRYVDFQDIKVPKDSAAKIINDFIGNGMTIKDVARHKDIVRLEKRVTRVEELMCTLLEGDE